MSISTRRYRAIEVISSNLSIVVPAKAGTH
jgi:hypothetical protein